MDFEGFPFQQQDEFTVSSFRPCETERLTAVTTVLIDDTDAGEKEMDRLYTVELM